MNGVGLVTDSYLYDSYGNIILDSGATTNWFRYIGQRGYYFDIDLTTYYVRARVFSSLIGRFVSRDPSGSSGRILRANAYLYADNGPANWFDPSGLLPVVVIPIGLYAAIMACAGIALRSSPEYIDDANDKFKHCYYSCKVALLCTSWASSMAGLSKEAWDELTYLLCRATGNWPPSICDDPGNKGASLKDLIANAEGGACAGLTPIVLPIVGCFMDDCYNCCNKQFPQGNPIKNPPHVQE